MVQENCVTRKRCGTRERIPTTVNGKAGGKRLNERATSLTSLRVFLASVLARPPSGERLWLGPSEQSSAPTRRNGPVVSERRLKTTSDDCEQPVCSRGPCGAVRTACGPQVHARL